MDCGAAFGGGVRCAHGIGRCGGAIFGIEIHVAGKAMDSGAASGRGFRCADGIGRLCFPIDIDEHDVHTHNRGDLPFCLNCYRGQEDGTSILCSSMTVKWNC